MKEQPKLCPHCGWGTIVDMGSLFSHAAGCNSCGAKTKNCKTWEEAIHEWNRRAEPENEFETCRGYSIHDLLFVSELLKSHMVEPKDIKQLCNNFQQCYDMVSKDINKQLQKSIDSVISGVINSEEPND